jgi:hypothetical protein
MERGRIVSNGLEGVWKNAVFAWNFPGEIEENH